MHPRRLQRPTCPCQAWPHCNEIPHIVASVSEDPATLIGNIKAPNGKRFEAPFNASTAIQDRVRWSGIGPEAGWRMDRLKLL